MLWWSENGKYKAVCHYIKWLKYIARYQSAVPCKTKKLAEALHSYSKQVY